MCSVQVFGKWDMGWEGVSLLWQHLRDAFNKFPDFFLYSHLKLLQTLENSVCSCYPTYQMSSQFLWFQVQINSYSSNWIHTNCHSWWISKMQSEPEDTLEEWYAKKFCFKLGKNDATETYGILQTAFWPSCMNWTSVFEWHKRFKEGRESVRDDERCARSKEVNTPELISQRVKVRVTMLRFWRGSGRCQHSSNRVSGNSTRLMQQATTPSLSLIICPRWTSRQFFTHPIIDTLPPVTFGYSLSSESVVMRKLRRWQRLWWRSLTRSHKRTSMGPPSRSC